MNGLPEQLPELQSYDTIILSNVAAGDMSNAQLRLLQSAIRDFGVGLICIGEINPLLPEVIEAPRWRNPCLSTWSSQARKCYPMVPW